VRKLEITTFIIAIIGFGLTLYVIFSTQMIVKEEREARAWQLLATKTSGNSGKGPAIETLAQAGADLRAIDISCATLGGGWTDYTVFDLFDIERYWFIKRPCQRLTVLQDVDVSAQNLGRRFDLSDSNLSGARIHNGDFTETDLSFTNLSGSEITGTSLRGANTQSLDASQSIWTGVDLSDLAPSGGLAWGEMDFSFSDWNGVVARKAELVNSCFLKTSFSTSYSDVEGAVITSMDTPFKQTDLRGSAFLFPRFGRDTSVEGANLTDTTWILDATHWKDIYNLYGEAEGFLEGCFYANDQQEKERAQLLSFLESEVENYVQGKASSGLSADPLASLRYVNFDDSFVVFRGERLELSMPPPPPQDSLLGEPVVVVVEEIPTPFTNIRRRNQISEITKDTHLIMGLPATIAPEFVCIVDRDFHEYTAPGRPPAENCHLNPVFVSHTERTKKYGTTVSKN
jgi:hypothetical protein